MAMCNCIGGPNCCLNRHKSSQSEKDWDTWMRKNAWISQDFGATLDRIEIEGEGPTFIIGGIKDVRDWDKIALRLARDEGREC